MAGSVRRLAEILKRGPSIGVFTCDDPEAAAAAIVATIQGYYVIGATARDVIPRGSAAGSLHGMCEGLVGIAAPATRTGRRRL
jgi:TetR/AcrR family transcriptional repressor of bet genes